ncbi:MAG: hypothetical protein HY042_02190 [Spirochaetia bacterium]|nr:hypothetical protein [Spirochaetia bacterium]
MDIFRFPEGISFLFRWGHFLFGITWIGMLYYFNFVQGAYFAEAEASAKTDATKKLVPRALWYFRWGAMGTLLTGLVMLLLLFSVPMLFFMGATSHLPLVTANPGMAFYAAAIAIIVLLELHALLASNGPTTKAIEKPVAVIHSGLVLTIVFYVLLVLL